MSNLQHLMGRFSDHPAVAKIRQQLQSQAQAARLQLSGLTGAQESFALAAVASGQKGLQVLIANSKEEAAYRHNDLEGMLSPERVFFFPDSFKRPAHFEDLHPTQILQRSETISKISGAAPDSAVLISYPEALFEKVVRPEVLQKSRIDVQKGEKLDVDFVVQVLVEYGFDRTDFVYEPGQFSIRGGIIDLFSYGNELPYRIELFDDEVETLRTFDPISQLSRDKLQRLSIVPNLNTRFRQEEKVSLLQILAPGTVIWVRDLQFLVDRLQYCFDRAEQFAGKLTALDASELREIFRDRAFLYPADILNDLAGQPIVFLEGKLDSLKKNFPDLF